MTAAAMKTSRIRLGMGVAVPSTRIVPTVADGLATPHQLAPGRIELVRDTPPALNGRGCVQTGRDPRVPACRSGTPSRRNRGIEFEGATRKITFMRPVPDPVNTNAPIRWHLSAMGPRSRKDDR
jgi:5,10-methylenetetrahydromethanopterin reductase